MAFKKFKLIDEVAIKYQLSVAKSTFLTDVPLVSMPESLKADLNYMIDNYPYSASETAIRETILFPILKEGWKQYDKELMLWSNKSISYVIIKS